VTFRAILKHHEFSLLAEQHWLDDLQTGTDPGLLDPTID